MYEAGNWTEILTRFLITIFIIPYPIRGFPSPRPGVSPGLRMGSRPPDMEVSCKYIE